jgi:hypothetical protein
MDRNMFESRKSTYHPRSQSFIRFNPLVARVLGSVNAALLFQKMQDYEGMYASADRAFFRTNADLMADCALGRYELQAARKILEERGVYTIFQKPGDQRNWFKVHFEVCDAIIGECNAIAHAEDEAAATPVSYAPVLPEAPLLETRPPLLKTSRPPAGNQTRIRSIEEGEEKSIGETSSPAKARPSDDAEVWAYAEAIGLPREEAEKWLTRNQAIEWKVGKSRLPVKDWKASLRTWKLNYKPYNQQRRPSPSSAAPLPAATPDELAQMRGFLNHAHYLADQAAKVKA